MPSLDDLLAADPLATAAMGPERRARALQGLEQLGLMEAQSSARASTQESPLVYLARPAKGKAKFLDITDFLSDVGTDEQEGVVGTKDGVELLMRPAGGKAKLEGISQAQWAVANTRILAELLASGQLPINQLADYLAYTVQICQLADRYTWRSVLAFDRNYRQKQAVSQCRWGAEFTHSRSVFLVEKTGQFSAKVGKTAQNGQPGAQNGPAVNGKANMGKEPTKAMPVCRKFHQGSCDFTPCKFRHICLQPGCSQPHTLAEHYKTGTSR